MGPGFRQDDKREGARMREELAFLTIAEAARLIERKELSPVELTRALIARAEQLDPQLNAYLLPTAERALEHVIEAPFLLLARVGGMIGHQAVDLFA